MARPIYETGSDLIAERAVISEVEEAYRCTARKLPKRYQIDFLLMRGKTPVAWAEVKCRNNPIEQYDTYMLSLSKYKALAEHSSLTGVPGFLIVRWKNAIGSVKIPCPNFLTLGGRADRNDPDDQEPIILIPISEFSTLKRQKT